MNGGDWVERIRGEAARVGYLRALERSLYTAANRHVCLRRLEIIQLDRIRTRPVVPARDATLTSRLATEAELLEMHAEDRWGITDDLIDGHHRDGDRCLLSFVGDHRAGYTWIHTAGRPLLMPGLRISIPAGYLYNFAGFTLPEFRGYGLQPYRHREILHRPEWHDCKGLIGFVHCTNWSSRRGQSKSGYRPLGSISLVGTHDRFVVLMSRPLANLGIRRLDA